MRLKVSSAKWRPFCLGLNVLGVMISYTKSKIPLLHVGYINSNRLKQPGTNFTVNIKEMSYLKNAGYVAQQNNIALLVVVTGVIYMVWSISSFAFFVTLTLYWYKFCHFCRDIFVGPQCGWVFSTLNSVQLDRGISFIKQVKSPRKREYSVPHQSKLVYTIPIIV